jgi:hypothetical protein
MLASTPAVSAGSFRGSQVNATQEQLDVVIESLSKYLWNGSRARPFVVKGSYPASVWIKEHSHSQIDLPYNDIDVVIDAPTPEDEYVCQYERNFGHSQVTDPAVTRHVMELFVDSVYVDGLIPSSNKTVQVVTLCALDNPEDLITKYSDINAVNIGFIVTPNKDGEPVIEKWEMSTEFNEFMNTETLEIIEETVDVSGSREQSIIRLLKKAQQWNMDYSLPDWVDSLNGETILPYYKEVLDSLEPAYKDVIYSRYDFVELYDGNLFMYVGKGLLDPPTAPIEDIELLQWYNGHNHGRHYGRHYGRNSHGRHYGRNSHMNLQLLQWYNGHNNGRHYGRHYGRISHGRHYGRNSHMNVGQCSGLGEDVASAIAEEYAQKYCNHEILSESLTKPTVYNWQCRNIGVDDCKGAINKNLYRYCGHYVNDYQTVQRLEDQCHSKVSENIYNNHGGSGRSGGTDFATAQA